MVRYKFVGWGVTYRSMMFSVFMAGSSVNTLMTKHDAAQPKLRNGNDCTNENP
jgi:hypothetical protein